MRKFLFSLTKNEEPTLDLDKKLFFFDDGTYKGIVDQERNYLLDKVSHWKIEGERAFYSHDGGLSWSSFSKKSSEAILTKIMEYYLLT